jgi:Putative heavy-metal chelation
MFEQPRDVLRASAFSVEAAEKWALEQSAKLPEHLFRLTALWSISFVRRPVPEERRTHYIMRLAQSQNYGLSTTLGGRLGSTHADIVGLDTRVILKKKLYKNLVDRTALIDLVMGYVSRSADRKTCLDGSYRAKYEARSELFADEAEGILRRKRLKKQKGRKPCALVIGATAGIISALVKRGFRVFATDLSPEVSGRRLGGVKVESGRDANTRRIKEADVAIITGMTLPNRTLPSLIETAKEHNTSTIIWAITGHNCGQYYTENGVDCVISDPSPFLLLPGPATMAIWLRKAGGTE